MSSYGFKVGDEIHGFAGGTFGRDSYDCRIVEAVGRDWIVTRNTNSEVEFASGKDLQHIPRFDRSYCDDLCEAKP